MATQVDKIIAFAKSMVGKSTGNPRGSNWADWCQVFVRICYEKGGIYGAGMATAADARRAWMISTNRNPPIGAAVYSNGTGSAGHVALYIGDGKVIEGGSSCIKENTLSGMVGGYLGWGYQYGKKPSGSYTGGDIAGLTAPEKITAQEQPKQEYDPAPELAALQKALDLMNAEPNGDPIQREIEKCEEHPELHVRVIINGDKASAIEIPVADDLQITYERVGTPGKLVFKTFIDPDNPIAEGDRVSVRIDGRLLFVGYVFTRQRDKDEMVSVTAYNQLRYLKNKDTKIFENLSASEILKAIADDFGLVTGDIDDTGAKLDRIEDNVTLMDMILNALDETLSLTGDAYTLFDKEGKLSLKRVKNMQVEASLVCADTAQNYAYKTSIDDEVYNQVKLVYDNKDEGSFDAYIEKDPGNIAKWGLLQHFEKIKHPALGELKSQVLLKTYNRLNRTLSIEGVLGRTDVIAGCFVPIMLGLGDLEVRNFMLVERVTHKISNGEYFMDLVVSGRDFVG